MKRRNIVFYFSDQQRWDTLGCYGQKLPVTPHLDELAREGTRFENAFTCQPVCGPARACLQSGMYATQTGCYRNDIELPLDIHPLATHFRQAGYETAYVGKWHLASNENKGLCYATKAVPEERRGGYLDYWMAADVLEFTSHGYNGYVYDGQGQKHEFVGYRADCINNYAIDFLHQRTREDPFFLFISQIEPHHQNDHHRFEGPDGSKRRFAGYEVPGDLVGTQGELPGLPGAMRQPGRERRPAGGYPEGDGGMGEHHLHLYLRPWFALLHQKRGVQALLPRRLHAHSADRLRPGL